MAGKIESKIIKKIEQKFKSKYKIISSYRQGKENGLPVKTKEKIYFPDLILKDKKSGIIKHIIEVETDPVRKSIVGASILADYCIGLDQPRKKIRLSFIIGNKETKSGRSGLKQLPDFQKRKSIIEKYLKNIYKVNIDIEEKITKTIN